LIKIISTPENWNEVTRFSVARHKYPNRPVPNRHGTQTAATDTKTSQKPPENRVEFSPTKKHTLNVFGSRVKRI